MTIERICHFYLKGYITRSNAVDALRVAGANYWTIRRLMSR